MASRGMIPVRTRMPGGVGAEGEKPPLPDCALFLYNILIVKCRAIKFVDVCIYCMDLIIHTDNLGP
jgi:hypothetical protein